MCWFVLVVDVVVAFVVMAASIVVAACVGNVDAAVDVLLLSLLILCLLWASFAFLMRFSVVAKVKF